MKKILFATTATAALALGGMASAQGISLFGDARLGLGYNINNEGGVLRDADGNTEDDVRAVSRVRFGVNMTGETNSGLTFGATIRADNAIGGQGGALGQTAGNVFVSGAYGTLTFGDTNAADEQWVGDLYGNYSLTGLGDLNETLFISNGGGFGRDDTPNVFNNPEARPTIRYDFEIAGFGLSLSSDKKLDSIGVGAGYAGEFGGGTFEIGLGYYDFAEFTPLTGQLAGITIPGGNQYSAVLGGTFGDYGANVIYNNADGDGDAFQTLGVGGTAGFGDFDVGAYWIQVIDADGVYTGYDGQDTFSLTGAYDLGGGASVNGGVAQVFGRDAFTDDGVDYGEVDSATVADFGIKMSF